MDNSEKKVARDESLNKVIQTVAKMNLTTVHLYLKVLEGSVTT